MKHRMLFCCALLAALLPGCVHMGGQKPEVMKDMSTFCVMMFENHSTQPSVGMLMTTAVTDALQRDGTYRLVPSSQADFLLSGSVTQLTRRSLLTDSDDSYLSREVGVEVHVIYQVLDRRSGRVVMEREVNGSASYFTDAGVVQTSLESALSYATRRAADDITNDLTMP
ncbi:MAG: LPS assembly lipoprotein LptE [Akkermansia sp.]